MQRLSLFISFVLFFLALPMLSMAQDVPMPIQDGQAILKVKVDLLSLPVVVVGKNGELVIDLEKENFRITACPSSPQVVAGNKKSRRNKRKRDLKKNKCPILSPYVFDKQSLPPLRMVIMVDTSGTTGSYLKDFSKPSVVKLIKALTLQRSDDRYTLWDFTEGARELVDWTNDITKAGEALKTLYSDGSSAIFDSIFLCVEKKMRTLKDFTKICFVVTDGIDNLRFPLVNPATGRLCPKNMRVLGETRGCRQIKSGDLVTALQATGTILYVVDFSKRYNRAALQSSFRPPKNPPEELGEIARLSGGERILVKDVSEAKKAFEEIARKIGRMYVMGFYVSDTKPGWYDLYLEVGEWKDGEFKVNKTLTDQAGYRRRWKLE